MRIILLLNRDCIHHYIIEQLLYVYIDRHIYIQKYIYLTYIFFICKYEITFTIFLIVRYIFLSVPIKDSINKGPYRDVT